MTCDCTYRRSDSNRLPVLQHRCGHSRFAHFSKWLPRVAICLQQPFDMMWNFVALACSLLLCVSASPPRSSSSFVLSSSQATYVVDLNHGCSISAAWAQGDASKTNLINTADLGRYVQVTIQSCVVTLPHCLLIYTHRTGELLCRTLPLRWLLLAWPALALECARLNSFPSFSSRLTAPQQTRFLRGTARATLRAS
jgi:hypothetical protein